VKVYFAGRLTKSERLERALLSRVIRRLVSYGDINILFNTKIYRELRKGK